MVNQKAYYSNTVAVSCASMRAIGALGQCAPGLQAVQTVDDSLFDDNPIYGRPSRSSARPTPAYTGT